MFKLYNFNKKKNISKELVHDKVNDVLSPAQQL